MATNVNIELEVRDEDAGDVKCAMQGKVWLDLIKLQFKHLNLNPITN